MVRYAITFSVAALVLASSGVMAAKVPSGSFLNTSVTTVQQLSQQVVDDAIVAARYAKHFRMPRNAVVDYFQAYVRIGRMNKDMESAVYMISGRTDIVLGKMSLKKGAYVFVGPGGELLLDASTGNPLADRLPLRYSRTAGAVPGGSGAGASGLEGGLPAGGATVASATGDGVVTKVLGSSPTEIGVGVAGSSVPAGVSEGLASMAAPITVIEPAVEIVQAIPVGAAPSGASFGIGKVLPLIAALGGVASLAGGGGGSTPPVPVVPEPATFVALAFGLSSALAMARHRRTRS